MPTHNLSAQLVNDIESEYKTASERINKTKNKPDINVSILKGELWKGNENAGLVHRSPEVSSGQARLLLTIDFND